MKDNQTHWFIVVGNQMWIYSYYLYTVYVFDCYSAWSNRGLIIEDYWKNDNCVCFVCVGSFHLQCNRDDPSDNGQVCVPRLGTGHWLAHGSLLYAAYSWIHHLHVLQTQGKHSSGKAALPSDRPYNINVFVQGVDMVVLSTQKCCLSSTALAQNDKAQWRSQAKRGQPFKTATLPSRNNGWSFCLMSPENWGHYRKAPWTKHSTYICSFFLAQSVNEYEYNIMNV